MEDKVITWIELMKHTQTSDVWILIDGVVYSVSSYLAEHPGGDDILMLHGGQDASKNFNLQNHTEYAISIRDQRKIGVIEKNEPPKVYKDWVDKKKKTSKLYDWETISQHNTADDLWVVMHNNVYDLTNFSIIHPGGKAVLLKVAGKDGTKQFEDVKHSSNALEMRKTYQIGRVKPGSQPIVESSKISVLYKLIIILAGIIFGLIYAKFFLPQDKKQ